MLNIPGFTYPVEEYLLEDVVELLGYVSALVFPKRRRVCCVCVCACVCACVCVSPLLLQMWTETLLGTGQVIPSSTA